MRIYLKMDVALNWI